MTEDDPLTVASGHWLEALLENRRQSGPPSIHVFRPEPEPEAVITRLGRFLYDVNIRDGLITYREGWTCIGRRWAESKGRRELARYCRLPAPSYTITL